MHIIEIPDNISEPIPVWKGNPLEAGKKYICTNGFTGQMLMSPWRVVINGETWSLRNLLTAHPFAPEDFDPDQNWNNRHIWLLRGGGYGDLLMMTPLIMELKRRWPACNVHVACGENYHGVFDKDMVKEELLPVLLDEYIKPFTAIVPYEGSIEGSPDGDKYHMADIFAKKCFISLESRKPHYRVYPEEQEWARDKYPRSNKKRIGVQFMAGALYRSYPGMTKVIIDLAKRGVEVYLFGLPNYVEIEGYNPNITNLMSQKLTFRESAAVLTTCDSCIAPDSSFTHLSSAMDIPCVGLYGPVPSSIRVSSKKMKAFDGKYHCAPCFFHTDDPTRFPAGMPCEEKGKCVALESIDPEDVVKAALNPSLSFQMGV